jgi:hypothetical protein
MFTDMLFEMILITRHIARIRRFRLRNNLRIPHDFPIIYSKFDIDLVYRTSLVSSFLSRFRKSAARKMTTIACAIFRRYRFISGNEEEIETTSHNSFPTGENMPIFNSMNIRTEPIEKRRKNQLRLRVFASYLATVLIFDRNAIYQFLLIN